MVISRGAKSIVHRLCSPAALYQIGDRLLFSPASRFLTFSASAKQSKTTLLVDHFFRDAVHCQKTHIRSGASLKDEIPTCSIRFTQFLLWSSDRTMHQQASLFCEALPLSFVKGRVGEDIA